MTSTPSGVRSPRLNGVQLAVTPTGAHGRPTVSGCVACARAIPRRACGAKVRMPTAAFCSPLTSPTLRLIGVQTGQLRPPGELKRLTGARYRANSKRRSRRTRSEPLQSRSDCRLRPRACSIPAGRHATISNGCGRAARAGQKIHRRVHSRSQSGTAQARSSASASEPSMDGRDRHRAKPVPAEA